MGRTILASAAILFARRVGPMGLTYFKRFRMEIDLTGRAVRGAASCRPSYRLLAWDDVAARSRTPRPSTTAFASEIDANVFPCLGDWAGCHRLMHEIRGKQGFLPGATWLVAHDARRRHDANIAARSKAFATTRAWARSRIWASRPSIAAGNWAPAC